MKGKAGGKLFFLYNSIDFFYFFFFGMFLLIQARPSLTPSPVSAEHGWICHALSRIVCKFNPSAISLARAAFIKSCLFANINTGTPISFSSASNSDNSFLFGKNNFLLKTIEIC